jgi:hypothetical protein
MRIAVDPGALIEGTERELTDLASAILEAAVLGEAQEPVLLTDEGVATITIRRTDESDDVTRDGT